MSRLSGNLPFAHLQAVIDHQDQLDLVQHCRFDRSQVRDQSRLLILCLGIRVFCLNMTLIGGCRR